MRTLIEIDIGTSENESGRATELIEALESSGYSIEFERQHHDTVRNAEVLSYRTSDYSDNHD